MNSSILNDQEFKSEIDDIFSGLEALQIDNPLDWWDLFISVVSGATISYTKRKARIKNSLKKYYETQIQLLEGIDTDDLTNAQKSTYNHHKARLDEILNDEIRGHQIRTKGQPKYEINEPDISMYSQFEKRYQSKNVIYQLSDDNGTKKTVTKKLIRYN